MCLLFVPPHILKWKLLQNKVIGVLFTAGSTVPRRVADLWIDLNQYLINE